MHGSTIADVGLGDASDSSGSPLRHATRSADLHSRTRFGRDRGPRQRSGGVPDSVKASLECRNSAAGPTLTAQSGSGRRFGDRPCRSHPYPYPCARVLRQLDSGEIAPCESRLVSRTTPRSSRSDAAGRPSARLRQRRAERLATVPGVPSSAPRSRTLVRAPSSSDNLIRERSRVARAETRGHDSVKSSLECRSSPAGSGGPQVASPTRRARARGM